MPIVQLLYADPDFKDLAQRVRKEFGIPVGPYNTENLKQVDPGTVVVGYDTEHWVASHLSPLVKAVLDLHHDMYEGNRPMETWVIDELSNGGEVHEVLPRYDSVVQGMLVPKDALDRLHLYSLDGTRRWKVQLVGRDGERESHIMDVCSIRKLYQNLIGKQKQTSVCMNVLLAATIKRIGRIVERLTEHEDINDFWIPYWKIGWDEFEWDYQSQTNMFLKILRRII